MHWLWIVLVCACAAGSASAQAGSRLVTIAQGPVLGYREPDADVFAFRSIPYATGPTGRDRYKAPLPPPTWSETFEAVDKGIRCPQGPTPQAPEDCLIANVYVPDTNATNLPVMVLVHGGAFQVGFGDSGRPVNLVNTQKLIAVTFNYRLSVHGFLCLGNEEAPGNAGMKDQVALLRWVQVNIADFGGNPSDVTIAGCSAGGASVDLLRISDTTDGLINKVIAASGGNAGSFGIQNDPTANAKFFASAFNFSNVEDISELTVFYTSTRLDILLSRSDLSANNHDSTVLWAPCVERDVGVERFLRDAPVNIMLRGEQKQLPVLYGFAEKEGIMRVPFFSSWRHLMNENFSNFLPGDLQFSSIEEKEAVARRVRQFYFQGEQIVEGHILPFIDFFTDTLFGYSMLRSVKLNAEHGSSDMFLYEYSFTDENTPIIPNTQVRGATHCDQFNVIRDGNVANATPQFLQMQAVMRELFVNFIVTGKPTFQGFPVNTWRAADGNRSPHMNLDLAPELRGQLLPERSRLWDEIYAAHYRAPRPPAGSAAALTSSFLWATFLISLVLSY